MLRTINLGSATTHQVIASSISTGLATAALYDPEPFSKAALGIAAAIASIFRNAFSGCGQTCTAATRVVNDVEPYLKANRDNYLAQPVRTVAMQQQAEQIFNNCWAQVVNGCSDPSLGDAGKRCISERQRGGVAPWCPNPGHTGCDWFALYYDPIANDVPVDAGTISGAIAQATGVDLSQFNSFLPLIILLLVVLIV